MTRWLLVSLVGLVVTSFSFAQTSSQFRSDVKGPPYPWTNLNFPDDSGALRFIIFADRTGGQREGIFDKGIQAANLLAPDLVMSVGDLIEGYVEDTAILTSQADDLDKSLAKLQSPFFYVVGNHDNSYLIASKWYRQRRGQPYYSFVYKNVLFLALCTEDPPADHISQEQLAYMKQALEANKDVRWTFVFMHKPIFHPDSENHAAWADIESLLKGRAYTVFAGHRHIYEPYTAENRKYTVLSTTGGVNDLTSPEMGHFDHIVWVTLRKNDKEPILANLDINGVLPWDVRPPMPLDYALHVKSGVTFSSMPTFLSNDPRETFSTNVTLTNTADIPAKVHIKFAPPTGVTVKPAEQSLTLPAGASKELPVNVSFSDSAKGSLQADVLIPCTSTAEYQLEGFKPFTMTRQEAIGLIHKQFCSPATGKITVDGKLDDWPTLAYDVSQPTQVLGNPKSHQGPEDGRFRFGVAYDDTYLYIAVEAFDDEASRPGPTVWQQDAVEVRINANPLDKQNGAAEWADLLPILVAPAAEGRDMLIWEPQKLPEGTKIQSVRTPSGYVTEMAVPLSYIESKQGKDWKTFRLNVAVDDYDTDGRAQLWWQGDWRTSGNLPGSGTFERK